MTQPETYSIAEAARILGLDRSTVSRHAQEGKIPAIRIGARWLIPRTYINQIFANVGQPRTKAANA